MSHDVERLAKVLYEGMPCPLGRWEDLSDAVRGTWFAIARSAMKAGVTLPTPPRATPLEAAAAALAAFDGIAWDAMMRESREIRRRGASSILAAAVGALSDEAVREVWEAYTKPSTAQDGRTAFRAALLARLTEGGN